MVSDLRDLSERWFQAWLVKAAATVERLAAEDYVDVAPSAAHPPAVAAGECAVTSNRNAAR